MLLLVLVAIFLTYRFDNQSCHISGAAGLEECTSGLYTAQ